MLWSLFTFALLVTTPIHKTGKPDRLKDLHFNGKSEISLWYLWLRRKCVIVKSKLASSYLNISLYLFRVHAITTIALLKGIQCNLHSKYHGMLSPLLSWQSRYWLCGPNSSLRRPYLFNRDLCGPSLVCWRVNVFSDYSIILFFQESNYALLGVFFFLIYIIYTGRN